MAHIAVFRVSQRKNRHINKTVLLIITALLAIFCFGSIWRTTSIKKTIRTEGINIVQSTNCTVFKNILENYLPIKGFTNNQIEFKNAGILGGITGDSIAVSNMSILSIQYPVLQTFYEKHTKAIISPEPARKQTDIDEDSENHIAGKVGEDESEESEPEKLNTDKIYTPSSVVSSGGITVINHTSYKIDIDKMKNEPLKLGTLSKSKPSVLLFHTHTSEAYSTSKDASDPYRTENPKYSVVRVGAELKNQLSKLGVKSYHNTTMHDFPSYTGSYERSLETVKKDIKRYPSAKVIFDIHRDAAASNEPLKTSVKIGNVSAARIMFVVGTDQMGLVNPNWRENLKLAIKLQKKANELYPGLCKGIDLRKERFNQHVAPGALIIEVGANGDTLEEAVTSMKYLAKIIKEVVK